jgi:hypothetical protein
LVFLPDRKNKNPVDGEANGVRGIETNEQNQITSPPLLRMAKGMHVMVVMLTIDHNCELVWMIGKK